MRKATKRDIQLALEDFAEGLGLEYSPYAEEFTDRHKIDNSFLPENKAEVEVTKETKPGKSEIIYPRLIARAIQTPRGPQEATLLGKVNAIAEHLGVDFEVQPEKVVATTVKAVKRTTIKITPVKAVKKGKK